MKLKEISRLPLPKNKKRSGCVCSAQVFDQTLILDCWKDGDYKGRYCIEKSGRYRTLLNGEWHKYRFRSVFGYAWYCWGAPDELRGADELSLEIADEFLNPICRCTSTSRVSYKIESLEDEYVHNKRRKAYHRKADRINALMDEVPCCPNDFEHWIFNTAFGGKEFMFFDKEKHNYKCTACGKTHKNKTAKHNDFATCSRTNKKVQIKRRQQSIEKEEAVMLCQPVNNSEGVARHFLATCRWQGTAKEIFVYEQIRIMLHKNADGGCKIYYGQRYQADEFEQDWWDTNPINKREKECYCYPFGIAEAVKNTSYSTCGIQYYANIGLKLNYNNIMWAHRKVGGIYEYLAKCGLHRLLKEDSARIYWGEYYGYLDPYGSTDTQVLCLEKQRINRLRQNNGGILYLAWLRYEEEQNIKIPEETLRWFWDNKVYPSDFEFINEKMSPAKIANYIQKQKVICGDTLKQTITTWKDYLSMAERLKMNTDAEQIYKPKDLYSAHQELVNRINYAADKKEASALAKKYPEATKVIKTLGLYEWGDEQYTVVAPKGIIDIVKEGRALSHCVGSSERYYDRIATRESYILFLRKSNQQDKPYYTLEVEPGGVIRQKRTTGDKQNDDIKLATQFLRKWQKVISERLGDKEKSLANKAKTLRMAEFEELRKNGNTIRTGALAGKLLADVLEADLMEVETA